VKITRIDVYRFRYTLAGGVLTLSGGRTVEAEDSTLVKISTDEGLVGWGESCPFSPTYMLAFPEGARAAIHVMAPALLGADPRQIEDVYARMDGVLYGHAYAKSPVDIACWDLLGQAAGLPVSDLLGGTVQPRFPIYQVVGVNRPEAMRERSEELRAQGFRRFQVKVGSGHWRLDVERARACLDVLRNQEVVIVDANAYWRQHEAAQFTAALEEEPIYLEQPCRTLGECLAIRRRTARPMILDETLTDLDALFAAQAAGAMDCAMLKLSRLGGISRHRRARDGCRPWGLAVTMEDAGGGDVVTAAMAHLAASTPPKSLLNGMLINMLVNERIAEGTPAPRDGWSEVSRRPGLGVIVDEKALGAPVFSVS
jgi:L-alanine-DL-glutamate epimerase-like enolase superfamily enzyme